MGNQFDLDEDEEQRRERRKQRIAEMKRQKERREQLQQYIKRYGVYGVGVFFAIIIICVGVSLSRNNAEARENETTVIETAENLTSENESVSSTQMSAEAYAANEAGTTADSQSEESAGANDAQAEDAAEGTIESPGQDNNVPAEPEDIPVGDVTFHAGFTAEATSDTVTPSVEDVLSEYAILMDASTDTIVAQKNAKTIINPASMTKILTILVAAEHVTDLDDTFTMTLEITDYAYVNDCSSVGFLDGEVVTVRDLFYGTILPSGGDAAVALATYVAGSHEAFVDMMNEKLEELGLSETAHFTNCVGLYDEEHYCTVYDMAMILKAAVENDLCREVLGARTYTTSATEQHPEGITISNWFIRRIEDKDTGGKVLGAKTGFVNQSGSCAASYEVSEEGTPYICVTAQAYSSWRCIYDHVALYKKYTPR